MCEICKSLHELPWRFFRRMLHVLWHDKSQWYWQKEATLIIKKMRNIAIRETHYILCYRNRNWDSPDLMQFWFYLILLYFNNSISSSICRLPIRSEIYNCTFKYTNKVSIFSSNTGKKVLQMWRKFEILSADEYSNIIWQMLFFSSYLKSRLSILSSNRGESSFGNFWAVLSF